jgi:uncharacterized protein HemY
LRDLLPDSIDWPSPSWRQACARIVGRCLAVEARHRYHDCEAVADDLRRLQQGRAPARSPGAEAWGRHGRTIAGAVGATITAIALFIAFDRQEAAERAKGDSLSVSEFLVRLLDHAAPSAHGPEITLAAATLLAEAAIPRTFADHRAGEARVRMAYGRACAQAGDWQRAEQHLERAIVLLRAEPDSNPLSIEWCERLLSLCRRRS